MRRFLCEYDEVLTEDDVRRGYEEFCERKDECTFTQYLRGALGKNGALTEILTADTPVWDRREALVYCLVVYGDEGKYWEDDKRWLNYYEIQRLLSWGYRVLPARCG